MRGIEPKVRASNLPLSHILSALKALQPLGMVDARPFPGASSKPAIPTFSPRLGPFSPTSNSAAFHGLFHSVNWQVLVTVLLGAPKRLVLEALS